MRAVAIMIASLTFAAPVAAQDGPRVAGYETLAVVAPVADAAQALRLAERHCARYGRFANFRWMDGPRAVFACDPRKTEQKPSGPMGGLY
jgi:hypothetical protein